jgi:hypothetical protein
MTQLDMLIDELGADLRPVRRLSPPVFRALGWLLAVVALALVLASFADLRGIAARLLAEPDMWLSVVGSTSTMILGAVAAFELSVPGRDARWALLPVPALLFWVAVSGLGCLRSQLIDGAEPASFSESQHCFTFIVALSVPLSILMVLMIRRACPLRPNLTAATIGIATAAGAATLLNFFHPFDAGAIDLAVHATAVGLVILANRLLSGRLLSPAQR